MIGAKYVGLSLIALHLLLILQLTGRQDQFLLSGLFWWFIATEIHQKDSNRRLTPREMGFWLGGFFTIVLLISSFLLSMWSDSYSWIRFYPPCAWLSWVLMTSQVKAKEYWNEFKLVILMILPQGYISHLLEPLIGLKLQTFLAATSNFILHYAGFMSSRDGIHLLLEHGGVTVEYGCAGMPLFLLLIQLVLLFSMGKNLTVLKLFYLWMKVGAIFIFLTSLRIAILALLVNQPNYFNYWHSQQGAEWFSVAAITIVIYSDRRLLYCAEKS